MTTVSLAVEKELPADLFVSLLRRRSASCLDSHGVEKFQDPEVPNNQHRFASTIRDALCVWLAPTRIIRYLRSILHQLVDLGNVGHC